MAAGDSGQAGLFFQDGDFVPGSSKLHYEHMTWSWLQLRWRMLSRVERGVTLEADDPSRSELER